MRLVTRAYVNKLIKEQFSVDKELNKDVIFAMYGIKPYKREGKSWLYLMGDIESIGLVCNIDTMGYAPIPHFEDKFWIDRRGTVLNITNGNIVKSYVGADEYEHITLRYHGKKYRKRIHSLMGKTYLGNPPMVNHIDGCKSNNNLTNLERSTNSANVKHAYDNNFYTTRGGKGTAVVVTSKSTGNSQCFTSMRKAEEATGVTRHRIKRIIENKQVNNTNWDFRFK